MLRHIRPTVPQIWGTIRGQSLGTINKFFMNRNIITTNVRHCSEDCGNVKIVKLTSRIQHGEGPYWDLESNALVYTDTFKATLYKLKTDREVPISPECFKLPNHDSVGFALRIKGKKDTWVVCGDRYMYELHWPDKGKVTLKQIHMIEKDKPKNQFNDGKADSLGRIWGGTLKRETDLSVPDFGGSLYMIDHNLKEHEILQKVSISNGLAWSNDNKKFYYIDSATRDIDEYTFDIDDAQICNKKVILNIKDHGYPGIADGMTIDENNHLWIAMFGGHEIIQVDPCSKKIMRKIKMPASYVTSVIWGGPNYDILYATTSHLHLDDKQMDEEPDAGCVYAIHGLGVKGYPSNEAVIKC